MIERISIGAVLSRVNSALKGRGDYVDKEVEILKVFSDQALRRVDETLARIDDNEDEFVK